MPIFAFARRRAGFAAAAGLAGLLATTPSAAAPAPAEPNVVVTADDAGATGDVHGEVDIAAPRALVWRMLTDCERWTHVVYNGKSCRVLQRDPAGRWDVREQISKGGGPFPNIRVVIRSDYDAPHTVHFHRLEGDLRSLDGDWRLEPIDGGAHTRVFYDSRVTVPFGAPAPIARMMLRKDMPRTLATLRDAVEADAGRP